MHVRFIGHLSSTLLSTFLGKGEILVILTHVFQDAPSDKLVCDKEPCVVLLAHQESCGIIHRLETPLLQILSLACLRQIR